MGASGLLRQRCQILVRVLQSSPNSVNRAAQLTNCARLRRNAYAHALESVDTLESGAHGHSVRQLFLVDVAVGRAEKRREDRFIVRPSPGFDSVSGITGGTQVYMVYEPMRAYPTHLVTYAV